MSEIVSPEKQYPSVVRVERFLEALHVFDDQMFAGLPVVLAPYLLIHERYITRDGEGSLELKAGELEEMKGSYPAVGDTFRLVGFSQLGEYLPDVEIL